MDIAKPIRVTGAANATLKFSTPLTARSGLAPAPALKPVPSIQLVTFRAPLPADVAVAPVTGSVNDVPTSWLPPYDPSVHEGEPEKIEDQSSSLFDDPKAAIPAATLVLTSMISEADAGWQTAAESNAAATILRNIA
ncbi:MAG: hypothetical protein JNK46_03225 [Methylobacteriaceae bacterium]|nr:hypothetical protein [Methylobacteriaceae bacterium]